MNNLFSRCRNNTVVFSNNLVVAPRRSFFEGTSKFLRPSIKSEYHQASYISSSPLVALYQKEYSNSYERNWWQLTAILGGSILLIGTNDGAYSSKSRMTFCETEATTTSSLPQTSCELTPSSVAKVDLEAVVESHSMDDLPIYTADDVSKNDGTDGKPIWMSYGGIVYDVTNFINNHPGGSDKILQAAGTAIEPYWYLYRQHFNSDLPMRLMERMAIGQLREEDQNDIDEQMIVLERDDPYVHEPKRNPSLKVHTDTPMNAEVPTKVLNESYITPNDLFYIRNHHPVPFLNEKQIREYRLQIDLSSIVPGAEEKTVSFTLDELKQMPKSDLIVTLQCSGNRRGGFNTVQRTSGTPWGQGAVSTAKFTGVKLRDLLIAAGLTDPIAAQQDLGIEHVRFYAIDGMSASIDIEKATSPYGDCIVAYEMNDEPLPRDHGFPLRVVVPGYAAVRHVKWLNRIELSETEAEGVWQRGLNYRPLPPGVTDASTVDLEKTPGISELSLYSGITRINRTSSSESINPGDRVMVKVGGWAYGGGGRNVIRVDVTGDNGATWSSATLKEGSKQRFRHAWAWVFWECDVPAVVSEDGSVHVASKAVDIAFNVQPESNIHMWNVRGLGNNSWYRAHAKVLD